jgi:lipoprotein-anchoring transpeptidase ErfK/SrfK
VSVKRREYGRPRLGKGFLVALALLALTNAGCSLTAFRYDQGGAGSILPGVTVQGVAVGGMTRAEAIEAVSAVVDQMLSQRLDVEADGHHWNRRLSGLGLSADVETAVDQALAVSNDYSWLSRTWHRLTNQPVTQAFEVQFSLQDGPIAAQVRTSAAKVAVPATDAGPALVGSKVVFGHSKPGQALQTDRSTELLTEAVMAHLSSVSLPLHAVKPAVTDALLGKTIVVNVSKNELFLYHGLKIERTYQVATAMQGFLTPPGAWEVVNKVENPTWYNPAPDGWGKDEPAVIPPGPANPLGTRALYLNAPGIRIHGSPATSSIGTYASHGCIRMRIPESEALYPLVPVGTKVFIVGAPPWGLSTDPGTAG